ncbi:MAG: hypothetical protein IJU77_02335 [Butyrivibrio sp.]|nr:hypothetical protein [Butyrivibrio sp.]
MKNKLNMKLIGLMAVGISAGLFVCPVKAKANEGDTPTEPVPEENKDSSTEENYSSEPAVDAAELIDSAEDKTADAESGFTAADTIADEASAKLDEIIEEPSSVLQFETTLEESSKRIEDAVAVYTEADADLNAATEELKQAKEILDIAQNTQPVIAAELAQATEKKTQIEEQIEENQETMEYYEEVLEEYADLEYSGYQTILDDQEALAATPVTDESYKEKQDTLAQDIMEYYILDAEEEKLTDVYFDHKTEEYTTSYEQVEGGAPVPVTQEISYWEVTYTDENNNTHSRNFQYNVDSDGNFNYNSVEIVPAGYKNASGNTIDPTDESIHCIDIKKDDGTRVLYAIDDDDYTDDVETPDQPEDLAIQHSWGLEEKKYEKLDEAIPNVVDYKYNAAGDAIDSISIIEYSAYKYTNTQTVQHGPENLQVTMEQARADATATVDKLNKDPGKKANDTYVYEIKEIKKNRLYKASFIIRKISTFTHTITVPSKISTYVPKAYTYVPGQAVADVVRNSQSIGSTRDEEYVMAMSMHQNAVADAAYAKGVYEMAKEDLDVNVKDLNAVNDKIKELNRSLISDEELEKLNKEHTVALAKVESAKIARAIASEAIITADIKLNSIKHPKNNSEDDEDYEKHGGGGVDDTEYEKEGTFGGNVKPSQKAKTATPSGTTLKMIFKDNANAAKTLTGASQVIRDEAARNTASEPAINKTYEAIQTYRKRANTVNRNQAHELISSLSPASKVILYIRMSRNYYLRNFKTAGFKFFDAMKYLAMYPDVMNEAKARGITDLETFALNHYLDIGIYEGRSSMTAFDPIENILLNPDVFNNISLSSDPLPDELLKLYSQT